MNARKTLRHAFVTGCLDVTADFDTARSFIRMFRGKAIARRALRRCRRTFDRAEIAVLKWEMTQNARKAGTTGDTHNDRSNPQ